MIITLVLQIFWMCVREDFVYIVKVLVRDRHSFRNVELGLLTPLQFGMYTFSRHFYFSALDNHHLLFRFVAWILGDILDVIDNVVPLKDLTKDDVLAIKPATSS